MHVCKKERKKEVDALITVFNYIQKIEYKEVMKGKVLGQTKISFSTHTKDIVIWLFGFILATVSA